MSILWYNELFQYYCNISRTIRPFLQYILLEQLLLIEFLNLRNHILDLLNYFQKGGVQDTFFGFYRREFIEFGKWVFGLVFFFVAKNLKIVIYWQKAMSNFSKQ